MRERCLAGARRGAPPLSIHSSRYDAARVWAAWLKARRAASRHRVDAVDLEHFVKAERREYRGKRTREHRFASAGRPREAKVVSACRGDNCRALCDSLARGCPQTQTVFRYRLARAWFGAQVSIFYFYFFPTLRSGIPTFSEERRDFVSRCSIISRNVSDAIHRDAGHKRRFPFVFFRDKHRALASFFGIGNERQNPAHGAEVPVERKLADKKIRLRVKAYVVGCKQVRNRNRQIKHRPFFF